MAKNTEKKGTTNINEAARKELSITRDDYALCQYLHYRQGYPNDKNPGWCVDDKNEISDFIGISRPGLYKMIDRLERLKLIETDAVTGHCRATKLFINTEAQCKQSLRDGKSKRVNKVNTECKLCLHGDVNKVTDKELMYSKNISKSKLDITANAAEPENLTLPLKEKKKEKTGTPGAARQKKEKTGRKDHTFTQTFELLKTKNAYAHTFFLNNPDIWDSVMRYRIEINSKFASAESEAIAMVKFWKDCNGRRENAEAMIEKTVSAGYKGFFPVENKQQPTRPQTGHPNGVNPYTY